jgi:thiamine-phosphate pyrophosphorylase
LASILDISLNGQERTLVDELRQRYADLKIEQRDPQEKLNLVQDASVYKIVKLACWQLGFVNQDAELIAQAWLKKSPELEDFDLQAWPSEISEFPLQVSTEPAFTSCPQQLGLYVVVPNAEWIKKLAPTNIDTLQLRFKSDDPQLIEKEVITAIEYAKDYPCQLFINDHWQLAIKHKAYGVHLGQEDLEGANFQEMQQAGLRLGISSHGYAEMLRALAYQPSYIAMGAIFPTTLKDMETAPQGLGRLKKYAALLKDYSTVGIGGIDQHSIKDVLATGVGSVAVVRAVTQEVDYIAAVKALKNYFSST